MLHWHIFNWYHVYKVTPYWLCFCFRQKGGDHCLYCFGCLPLCWWLTKRGRIIWEFNMHIKLIIFLYAWLVHVYICILPCEHVVVVCDRGKTPLEVWSGKTAADYDFLRVFGCPAYYHVKDDKLDPRVKKGVFVSFKKGIKDSRYGIQRTGSFFSAGMSHSMRLLCWSLRSLSRWRLARPRMYRSRWRMMLIHYL